MGTKQTTHTPGPWKCEPKNETEIRAEFDGQWIAECSWYIHSPRQIKIKPTELANARLIAAAPDLLAAAQLALAELHDHDQKCSMIEMLRAAIAKAEGGN